MYGFSYRVREFFSRIGRLFSFTDGLYSDIGNKICVLAKICGVLGLIVGVLGAVVLVLLTLIAGAETIYLAPAVAVSGIAAVIVSWPLYAFGQMVQDIHMIRYK